MDPPGHLQDFFLGAEVVWEPALRDLHQPVSKRSGGQLMQSTDSHRKGLTHLILRWVL